MLRIDEELVERLLIVTRELERLEKLLLKEIGEVLGVTESRVSQIHTRALYRLNRALAGAMGSSTQRG